MKLNWKLRYIAVCFWSHCSVVLMFPRSVTCGCLELPSNPLLFPRNLGLSEQAAGELAICRSRTQWFIVTINSTFSCFNKETMYSVYWFMHTKWFLSLKGENTYSPEILKYLLCQLEALFALVCNFFFSMQDITKQSGKCSFDKSLSYSMYPLCKGFPEKVFVGGKPLIPPLAIFWLISFEVYESIYVWSCSFNVKIRVVYLWRK